MALWRTFTRCGAVFALSAAAAVAVVPAAHADDPGGTPRYVATTGDDTHNTCADQNSPCLTIQHAVMDANVGDTVYVASGAYAETVRISKSLTLVGAGATGADRTTISGSGDEPSIIVGDTEGIPTVSISGVDVSGNADSDGIVIDDADATVSDSVVQNNFEDGIYIHSYGSPTIELSNVTVSDNRGDGLYIDSEAESDAAPSITVDNGSVVSENLLEGVDVYDGGAPTLTFDGATISDNNYAGIFVQDDTDADVTVTGSQVTGNGVARTKDGPHYDASGLAVNSGTLTVDSSTLSGNAFDGIYAYQTTVTVTNSTLDANYGTGLALDDGADATLDHSTVSNTRPAQGDSEDYDYVGETLGAGVLVGDGATATIVESTVFANTTSGVSVSPDGSATIENSTVSGTTESEGVNGADQGGVTLAEEEQEESFLARPLTESEFSSSESDEGSSAVTLRGTIVAGNSPSDCSDTVTDGGYNLDGDGSCGLSGAKNSISGGTADLGGLAANGGPTKTLLPGAGSQAIDAIPSGEGTCTSDFPSTDQRGITRPQGSGCDIGAVEVAATAPAPPVVCPPLTVVTLSLPDAAVGQPYSQQLQASGDCDSIYHWTLASGSLPPGLSLSDGGLISGTPTQAGDFSFTVSVNDPVLKDLTVHVAAPTPTPSPSTSASVTPTPTPTPSPSSSVLATSAGNSAAVAAAETGPSELADTGAPVGGELWTVGLLLGAGAALLLATRSRRRPRRAR